jgi:alpha-1,6-mannosyltransferase
VREPVRRALAVLSLVGLLGASLLVVVAAATYPTQLVPARLGGFPGWLRGPLSDLIDVFFFPADFGFAIVVMTACYLVALACAEAVRPRWVIVTVVALHVIFFLGPPLVSSDVFGYLDWARMAVLHGLNPYSTDSGAVVSDPVYPFVRWPILPSPYGPLFTLASYTVVPLGLPGSLWALKLIVTGSSLGCVALIWRTARALRRSPRAGVALYGLNPAVLVYAVGGFHNDVIMILAVLGAVYLAAAGRERLGAATAIVAVAIKSTAGLVLPFLILGSRDRRASLLAAVGAAAAVMAVAVVAFGGQALDFLNVLGTQQRLNSGTSVPAQLGAWLGWTGSPTPVRLVASALGIAALLWLVAQAWRGADWIDCAGWATVAVMVTSSWFLAWYIVWLVPLASLARSLALRAAAVGMSLFVILVRVVPVLG